MGRYIAYRLSIMLPTLIAISALIFIIIQLPPGDYLSNQIIELRSQGEEASLAKVEYLRSQFGFDKPLIEQYGVWIGVWPGASGFSGYVNIIVIIYGY